MCEFPERNVAKQTVELNKSLDVQSSAELTNEFHSQLNAVKARYDEKPIDSTVSAYARIHHAQNAFALAHPVKTRENELPERDRCGARAISHSTTRFENARARIR